MRRSLFQQHGVISIEFALGALLLIMSSFAVFELSRFVYMVNLTETALSESTRDTKVFEAVRMNKSYEARLKEMFEHKGELWHSLTDVKRYTISRTFYSGVEDLASATPSGTCGDRCPIVEVTLSYQFEPIYNTGLMSPTTIQRSLLVIQEHEGWADEL